MTVENTLLRVYVFFIKQFDDGDMMFLEFRVCSVYLSLSVRALSAIPDSYFIASLSVIFSNLVIEARATPLLLLRLINCAIGAVDN